MIECGLKIEAQHHEVATGGQGEIDMQFAPLVEMADNVLKYKYIVKNVATQARQDGDVHAQAALPGQRHRHARPHVAVEERQEPVRRLRLRRPVRHGPVRHRRPAAARPRPVRHHQPDDQQLQAAGARLRGAGQPRLQPPQPLGVDPHPGLLAAAPRPSASSSAARTARATRTWPSRRC